ncbi:protein DBF4 homolog A isoform X2 [Dendropsophus ebraccatus]
MQRGKGGTQGRGVKMKPGHPPAKNLPDNGPTQKPLTGRVFYLDVASRVAAEKLEKDIKELGGTVEGFLSKEISCLITSKKEAKCTKSLKYPFSMPSPEPAQNSGSSSARPSGHRGDGKNGSASKKPEKEDASRGKSLLKKVIKQQEILPKNSILANALNWGVRILHLDEAKVYLEQKKRSVQPKPQREVPAKPVAKRPARRKVKVQKLNSPFIKVEDSGSQYRPMYLTLPMFRSFQPLCLKISKGLPRRTGIHKLITMKPSMAKKTLDQKPVDIKPMMDQKPVDIKPMMDQKPVAVQKVTEVKQSLNKTWHGQDEGNIAHNKLKEQKKRGYCECCLKKYEDLEAHLLSHQHKKYAQGPYYQDVDNLITSFDFDFVDWSKFRQEAQGSGLFIPPQTVKQVDKGFLPQMNHVAPKFSNLESGAVQGPESMKPPATTCVLLSNLVCHSEPIFTVPCPPQSICSITGVTDSFSKPPSSQVITPTHENISPAQLAEPINISLGHHVSTQNDSHLKDPDSIRLVHLELPDADQKDHKGLTEPVNDCPYKRLKLDDSLCSATLETAVLPRGIPEPSKDLTSLPLGQSDALCHLPPSSPSSKLHRKVKLDQNTRRVEEPPCNPSKVSVPLEDCVVTLSKERLECIFRSSEDPTEFYGFSCNSMDPQQCIQEQPSSYRPVLWSLFSSTDSESTFKGF